EISGRGARLLLADGAINGQVAPVILVAGTAAGPLHGVALRGPGGKCRRITFADLVSRDAPRDAWDGNAFEIEDGAEDILIQDALVENVAANTHPCTWVSSRSRVRRRSPMR